MERKLSERRGGRVNGDPEERERSRGGNISKCRREWWKEDGERRKETVERERGKGKERKEEPIPEEKRVAQPRWNLFFFRPRIKPNYPSERE